jgi:hypothetical protein
MVTRFPGTTMPGAVVEGVVAEEGVRGWSEMREGLDLLSPVRMDVPCLKGRVMCVGWFGCVCPRSFEAGLSL